MQRYEIEIETPYGVFRDAISYPDDVTYTPEQLEQLAQERVQNWLSIVAPQE